MSSPRVVAGLDPKSLPHLRSSGPRAPQNTNATRTKVQPDPSLTLTALAPLFSKLHTFCCGKLGRKPGRLSRMKGKSSTQHCIPLGPFFLVIVHIL